MRPLETQPYLPDVLASLVRRYKFIGFPSGLEELSAASKRLSMGSWAGSQIDELKVYNDGVIVDAPQNSDVIDAFIDDLYGFVRETFRYVVMSGAEEVRHYESAIVVKLAPSVTSGLSALHALSEDVSKYQAAYGLPGFEFEPTRLGVDVDASKHAGKRPISFTLERRLGEPFEQDQWFSSAPLKSNDHIAVMRKLEKALMG